MPRPRPPHLHRETTRHGVTVWYVRKGQGPRVRIRAAFGTPEFDQEYQAALTGERPQKRREVAAGSLTWLLARYRETAEWAALSPATRRQRDNIFVHVIEKSGHHPATKITKAHVISGKERRAATPAQARNFLDAMRGLFRWAHKAGMVKVDPTAGVDNPPRKAGDGFMAWTEAHVEAYYRKWKLGTRQRVWLDVLLYTGLRRGDAVLLGRQHVRDGIATIRTEKSGGRVEVTLKILPELQATLDTGPCGDMFFIVGANGRPLTKESFGNEFRQACKDAGVPGSAHGVRKIAATRAANNGATDSQLKALFAWRDGKMPSHYTQTADRRRMAIEAIHLLSNDTGTSIPAPDNSVRETDRKGE